MSVYAGPEIANQDLVIYFDAANRRSVANVNAWTDIISSANINHFNSPAYTTEFNGGYEFRGGRASGLANTFMQGTTFPNLPFGSNSRTVIVWCKPSSAGQGTYQYLVGYSFVARSWTLGITSSSNYFVYYPNDIPASIMNFGNARCRFNEVNRIVYRYDNDDSTTKHTIFVNEGPMGIATINVAQTIITTGTSTLRLGIRLDDGDNVFSGNLYCVKIYNRALSNTEIDQEYTSMRGRFGI